MALPCGPGGLNCFECTPQGLITNLPGAITSDTRSSSGAGYGWNYCMPGIYRNPWTDEPTVNGYEEDTSDFLELVYHPNMVLFFLTCLRLAAALRNLLMSIYKDYQKAKADSEPDTQVGVR